MLKEINWDSFDERVFHLIAKEWFLITAGDSKINTMTANWGGLGYLWNQPVAFIFIRPQRYTKQFVDQNERLTLSFFDQSYLKQLSYLGNVSGQNEDKIKISGLTPMVMDGVPTFKEARIVMVARKCYAEQLKEGCMDPAVLDKIYPERDLHTLYIVSLEHIYLNK